MRAGTFVPWRHRRAETLANFTRRRRTDPMRHFRIGPLQAGYEQVETAARGGKRRLIECRTCCACFACFACIIAYELPERDRKRGNACKIFRPAGSKRKASSSRAARAAMQRCSGAAVQGSRAAAAGQRVQPCSGAAAQWRKSSSAAAAGQPGSGAAPQRCSRAAPRRRQQLRG
jgi:hypothetical protein